MPTVLTKFFAIILTFGPHTHAQQHHSTAFVPPSEVASSIQCNIPSHHDLLNGYGTTISGQ